MQENESAWRRGRSDTILAAKSFPFFLLEVGGTAVIGIITQNGWATLIFCVGILSALFIGSTATAPIRQRNDERKKHRETQEKLAQLTETVEQKNDTVTTIGIQNNFFIIQNTGDGKESHESIATTHRVFFIDVGAKWEINDSENVSGYTDHGVGDYSINFLTDVNPSLLVVSPIDSTPPFKVLELSKSHVRIKFEGDPDGFKLRIDAPEKSQIGWIP